jgi:hypothetical protein
MAARSRGKSTPEHRPLTGTNSKKKKNQDRTWQRERQTDRQMDRHVEAYIGDRRRGPACRRRGRTLDSPPRESCTLEAEEMRGGGTNCGGERSCSSPSKL